MKVLIMLFFTTALAQAAASDQLYRFGSMMVAFREVDGFVVNRSCAEKNCDALKVAKKFKDKWPDKKHLLGGKNPSAVKCKVILGGKVMIGTDRLGNEQSFCFFKDQSFLKG